MKTAQRFMKFWDNVPYDEDGLVVWQALKRFKEKLKRASVLALDTCQDSQDSPRIYLFRDGSAGVLFNPIQDPFTAFYQEANGDETAAIQSEWDAMLAHRRRIFGDSSAEAAE